MRKVLWSTWKFIRTWFARICTLIIALCLILRYFDFPISERLVPGLMALLLVGVYEIILESKFSAEQVSTELSALKNEVDRLSRSASSLVEQLSPKLYALFQC